MAANRMHSQLEMLIPGKSYSRDESRNSRVSIETLDFARVCTFTCVIGVGSPAQRGGGAITDRTQRCSQPMTGPHRRLRTINVAGSSAPKTAGGRVRWSATEEAQRPSAPGPRNHCLPPSDASGQSVDVAGGMGA